VVANVVLARTKGHQGGWLVIATGWGLAVFIGVFCSQHFSGAHLNPAVTLAMATAGKLAWAKVPGYVLAQMSGGLAGGALALAASPAGPVELAGRARRRASARAARARGRRRALGVARRSLAPRYAPGWAGLGPRPAGGGVAARVQRNRSPLVGLGRAAQRSGPMGRPAPRAGGQPAPCRALT